MPVRAANEAVQTQDWKRPGHEDGQQVSLTNLHLYLDDLLTTPHCFESLAKAA